MKNPASYKVAIELLTERVRQQDVEGWTYDHDDAHDMGEMAQAAACYALTPSLLGWLFGKNHFWEGFWPWSREWWKPTNRRRDLVKSGALIIAEIERIDRLGEKENSK